MDYLTNSDPISIWVIVLRVSSVAVLLSSLEFMFKPRLLRSDGLLSWDITRLDARLPASKVFSGIIQILLNERGFQLMNFIRVICSLILIFFPYSAWVFFLCIAVIAISSLLQTYRSVYGLDGADQLLLHIFISSALFYLQPTPEVSRLILWYITCQALLAYGTAGIYKAISPDWTHSGRAVSGVLRTRMYGTRQIGTLLLRFPRSATALSYGIILLELALVASIFTPDEVTLVILMSGAVFHAINAALMGLNTFFWAFAASYPAIYFCATTV